MMDSDDSDDNDDDGDDNDNDGDNDDGDDDNDGDNGPVMVIMMVMMVIMMIIKIYLFCKSKNFSLIKTTKLCITLQIFLIYCLEKDKQNFRLKPNFSLIISWTDNCSKQTFYYQNNIHI